MYRSKFITFHRVCNWHMTAGDVRCSSLSIACTHTHTFKLDWTQLKLMLPQVPWCSFLKRKNICLVEYVHTVYNFVSTNLSAYCENDFTVFYYYYIHTWYLCISREMLIIKYCYLYVNCCVQWKVALFLKTAINQYLFSHENWFWFSGYIFWLLEIGTDTIYRFDPSKNKLCGVNS